jgi:hypothetical protein
MNKLSFVLGVWAVFWSVSPAFPITESAFSAREIMDRALERAQCDETQAKRSQYRYMRVTSIDELDSKGKLLERKERVHDICMQSGVPSLRGARINGRRLTPGQLRIEEEMETNSRKNYSGSDGRSKHFERILSPDLVERYNLRLVGSEVVDGRRAFVIEFKPKGGLRVKQTVDRLLNQLHGRIWIDAQEFELAKADVRILNEVKLWGGLLASVRDFHITLDRTRLDDGAWFNRASTAYFDGRKLFGNVHVHVASESVEFRKGEPGG